MKLILAVIFVVLGIQKNVKATDPEESKQMIRDISSGCKEAEGATDDHVENMINNGMPEDPADKCLRACMMEQFGVMADCKLNADNLVEITKMATEDDDEKVALAKEMADECKDASGAETDRCECAVQIINCLHAGAQKRGLDPAKL